MTTNDEIINKHFPRTKEGFDIENVRDSINVLMNEARLDERVSLVYEIESGCLSYIPRKMKTKREEEISSEGYVHGVKSALEVIKNSNPADIFDWNKIIKGERLAALDDCKTLLERVLSEISIREFLDSDYVAGVVDGSRGKIEYALAELEALELLQRSFIKKR